MLKEAYDTHETYDTDVPQEPHDSYVTEESQDSQESQDSEETQDTQTPTTNRDHKLPPQISESVCRKLLVVLGRKYSKTKFGAKRVFQLASNVMALEIRSGREFSLELRKLAYDSATERSKPEKRYAMYWNYIQAFNKIDTPMADNTIVTALGNVAALSLSDLPEIPGLPLPEPHRRIHALHREMSRLCNGKDYFLSRRMMEEAAGAKLDRHEAIGVCALLEAYGLIKIVDRGKPGRGQGKGAARYRYIDDDGIPF